MLELLMAALQHGDTNTVYWLLKLMPSHMFFSLDVTKSSVLHYLARFNHLEAFVIARKKFPIEKFKELSLERFTPFITAIYYNRLSIVNYFMAEGLDKFCSDLHRAAFFNEIKTPVDPSLTLVEDAAGFLPIHYAVAAGNLEALALLLQYTPPEKLEKSFIAFLLGLAIENRHGHLFSILKALLEPNEIVNMLSHSQKRFIDELKNKKSLLEKIEEAYENPATIIKALINEDQIKSIERTMFIAVQHGCKKILTGLLDGYHKDNLEERQVIIECILHVAVQIYITMQMEKKPNILDKEILDIAILVCMKDIEDHPVWLSSVLLHPVQMGLHYPVDVLLKRLSPKTKKEILEHPIPDQGMGTTLLHAAVREENAEMLLVLTTHGGSVSAQDERKISVQEILDRSAPHMRLASLSKELPTLFVMQELYYRYVEKILDEGRITEPSFLMLVKAVDGIKKKVHQYDALKDAAFTLRLWKCLLQLIQTDFDNPLTKKLYFFIKKDIETIKSPEEKVKNCVLAFRASFVLGEYEESLHQLDNICGLKDILKTENTFNHANVPQILMARMMLTVFLEAKLKIPAKIFPLLEKTTVSASYNMLMGGFCINFLNPEDFSEKVLFALYKRLNDVNWKKRRNQLSDLKSLPLHKRKNEILLNSDNYMTMMQETHTEICIFWQFITELENTLTKGPLQSIKDFIQEQTDLSYLNRLLAFYQFKHEALLLFDDVLQEFKKATAFSSKFSEVFLLPTFNVLEDMATIKLLERKIATTKRAELLNQSLDVAIDWIEDEPEKKAKIAGRKKSAQEENKNSQEEVESSDDEEALTLPDYHLPAKSEEKLVEWAEKNNIILEKIYLKKIGVQKRIPLMIPTFILNYMRYYGSDGCLLTGGALRDLFLGRVPKDWDMVVDGKMDDLEKECRKDYPRDKIFRKGKIVGKQTLACLHGPFTVELSANPHQKQTMLAELRRRDDLTDEERKSVRAGIRDYYFQIIQLDETKRDFPYNAMAINYYTYVNKDLQKKVEVWQLFDEYNGYEDLKKYRQTRLIPKFNAIQQLQSDPIIALRAIRHCCRLGLWGAEDIIKSFNEGGVHLRDALFAVTEGKLKSEYDNFKEVFKDDLLKVLDTFEIRDVFVKRGIMPGPIEGATVSSQGVFANTSSVSNPKNTDQRTLRK